MFDELVDETFDQREQKILEFWAQKHIFERSIEKENSQPFSFYDGPPFATGLPHYGHLLAGTIKDVVPRYKTMKGFRVQRRFGWDCHGLPIEQEIEKAQNLSGALSIQEFGIARFNEECRKIVLRYTKEWETIVKRMGRWVDFSNTYRTMDLSFMETVWWVFKQLHDKGLVYEGYKVMPFSAKLGTPLSNFEAGENYKEVDDPAITVAFSLQDEPEVSLLAWTTTPWTLVSNLALMVGPDIQYVKIREEKTGRLYILAASRLSSFFKNEEEYAVLNTYLGEELVGRTYRPLFDYFKERAEKGAFRVIADSNVSLDEGTGIVHTAPAFGEVDFYACQKEGIELVCPVDNNGLFTSEVPDYLGLFVKDADKDIIKRLKAEGRLYHQATIHHRYPFCWRSDTPLIYKAVSTWFVSVEKVKTKMLAANEQIHWTPGHIKYGRFGKWLEGARDWSIGRNRYWGTPIPLYRSEDGEVLAIGSISELEELTGAKVQDLHRHFIDDLTFTKDGKQFKRISEVFDCWFESGSMPYAQNHYPFENQAYFEENFPADFIAEGLDQTRGWFYTLTVLAASLFDKPAFKNVIVNGIILAEDGTKMSKRLKNYPDPMEVVHKYGADAVRLYMMHSPAVKGDDLCFSEGGVELVLRQILLPMWNAYSFFLTYANVYAWCPEMRTKEKDALIDHWLVSISQKLVHEVENGMDNYDLSLAVEPFVGFVDQLTNWYIRRSRRRFWSDEDSADRRQAFTTLYEVLLNLVKIAAPFVPFISEAIYRNLRTAEMPESVHLADFPIYHQELRNEQLEQGMAAIQRVVSLGHGLRKENKLKVRQPLALAEIACKSANELEFLQSQQHLIAEELNVKKVLFHHDDSQFVLLRAKPNFRVLGKKIGKLMQQANFAISQFSHDQLESFLEGQSLSIDLEGQQIVLGAEDVQVERIVREGLIAATENEITIALETTLNEELLMEGLAREIVNKVNTMRREAKLEVSDRIHLQIEASERVKRAFDGHREYIVNEVLASRVDFEKCEGTEWDLNGELAKITISKKLSYPNS
ncbi:Isoleucine--tRNA ligase [Chlamydiales bacterium STE3]|nr:Isoleucine--tRNA ligase [Chlamydiales bacterium STE3]